MAQRMAVDPDVIRAESHEQLGRLISDNVALLVYRWQQRALEEQPAAPAAHRETLVDHLPPLLSAIAVRLRSEGEPFEPAAALAEKHGEHRWQTGWSLTEVIRDYQILRLVVLDFLEEALGRPIAAREAMAVSLEIDDAIIESVNAFVASREDALLDTERQRAERDRLMRDAIEQGLVREAETLKAIDRRKNEFLALLGHELRNPLGAMSNALQLTQILPPGDPDYQQAAGVLSRQLRQIERLVDDLLDVTRIGRGMLELRREDVDLLAAAREAVETVRPMAESRRHEIKLSLCDKPLHVSADPSRLQQVLSNLLVNAIRYTPPGGRISLSVERQQTEAVVRVSDNGIGIAPDMLPAVFDMFMRAETAARQSEAGLGLGLTLVRNLVEMHGGTVQVFSAGLGKGSEFSFRLPLPAAADQADKPQQPLAAQPVARLRVLVVDDNQDVAMTLAAVVRHNGHEVRLAHDGPAAVEAAKTWRADLVLIDIGLPGINGYDVARRLREELGLKQSLLVALTGYGQEEDRRRSFEAGFDRHIVKPVRSDTLMNLLAEASHVAAD